MRAGDPGKAERTINVLLVDDSKVAQMLLVDILEADPRIRVIGVVGDGQAAVDFVARRLPDVILMDIQMPTMNGVEATRRIMETRPVPIVVCTGTVHSQDVSTAFRVMEAGALACIEKPAGRAHPEHSEMSAYLRDTVKTMSEVKLVRRWPRGQAAAPRPAAVEAVHTSPARRGIGVVGIGASTGGPQVLQQILGGLPGDFAAPILVVQHIAHGFLAGLAEWLDGATPLGVHVAAAGTVPLPGHVYLAPDDFHMGVTTSGRILLTKDERQNHLRPAVSYLFRSLAHVYGAAAVGVLLTGMGKDGAAELKMMRDAGAVTIAQDSQTSVVDGMPGEAVRLGAATRVLRADKIAAGLLAIVPRRDEARGDA